jgi:hypothetical protein
MLYTTKDSKPLTPWGVMQRKTKIIAGTGIVLAAGLGVGLGLAWPLTGSSGFSGTETIAGTQVLTPAQANSNNFVPAIPLTASGAFADTGSIKLTPGSGPNGNGSGSATVVLTKGNLAVHHGATPGNGQPVLQKGSCAYALTEQTPYTFTGGTGAYAGATGHGTATVSFSFYVPKLADGECNTSSSVAATGGKVTFRAVGPVSVP